MDHKSAKFIVSLYIIVFPPRIDDPRPPKTFLSSFVCHNGVNFCQLENNSQFSQ